MAWIPPVLQYYSSSSGSFGGASAPSLIKSCPPPLEIASLQCNATIASKFKVLYSMQSPWECTRSSLRRSNFLGSVRAYAHVHRACPPLFFIKTHFAPLDHFLNEGLSRKVVFSYYWRSTVCLNSVSSDGFSLMFGNVSLLVILYFTNSQFTECLQVALTKASKYPGSLLIFTPQGMLPSMYCYSKWEG